MNTEYIAVKDLPRKRVVYDGDYISMEQTLLTEEDIAGIPKTNLADIYRRFLADVQLKMSLLASEKDKECFKEVLPWFAERIAEVENGN